MEDINEINPYPPSIKRMQTHSGFWEIYCLCLTAEKDPSMAYAKTEGIYSKYYGQDRFDNYESFLKAMKAHFKKLQQHSEYPLEIRTLWLPENFEAMWFRNLARGMTNEEAYENCEEVMIKYFGQRKHKSFRSFQECKNLRLRNLRNK